MFTNNLLFFMHDVRRAVDVTSSLTACLKLRYYSVKLHLNGQTDNRARPFFRADGVRHAWIMRY